VQTFFIHKFRFLIPTLVLLAGCQTIVPIQNSNDEHKENPFVLSMPPRDADFVARQSFYDKNAIKLSGDGKNIVVDGDTKSVGSLAALFSERGEPSFVASMEPNYWWRVMFGIEGIAFGSMVLATAPRAGDSSNQGFGSYQTAFIVGLVGLAVAVWGYWSECPNIKSTVQNYDRHLADQLGLQR
jgi:hypothetical protein